MAARFNECLTKRHTGRAFEHRIQLGVAASITLLGVVLPLTIYRIKEQKKAAAPRGTDGRRAGIAMSRAHYQAIKKQNSPRQ